MGYSSSGVSKLDYARFVSASLCYMASTQRDATGLIIFDEDVNNYVPPSTRQGQLFRLLHAIEEAHGRDAYRFHQALRSLPEFSASPRHCRGDV